MEFIGEGQLAGFKVHHCPNTESDGEMPGELGESSSLHVSCVEVPCDAVRGVAVGRGHVVVLTSAQQGRQLTSCAALLWCVMAAPPPSPPSPVLTLGENCFGQCGVGSASSWVALGRLQLEAVLQVADSLFFEPVGLTLCTCSPSRCAVG